MKFYLETLADPEYFAPLEKWRLDAVRHPHLAAIPHGPIECYDRPPQWGAVSRGPWTVVAPFGSELQPQGWKVHLAPALPDVAEVVAATARLCFDRGLTFKHLARHEYAWALNGKYAPRTASGKIVVVYPDETTDLDELFGELLRMFRGYRGPRVLGDYRLGDSIVHTRYGAFTARYGRDAAGEPVLALTDPAGELVPDRRGVRPYTPPFAERPAAVDAALSTPSPQPQRPVYTVDSALHLSNTGGVYRARNIATGDAVTLKEARHFTGFDAGLRSAVDRLRAQRDSMRALADTGVTPEVLDYFTQGDSDFLAYRFAPGSTLQEWSAARNPALIQGRPDQPVPVEAARAFAEAVTGHMERLARLVAATHAAGIVLVDLHPANVIVEPSGELRIIDLEAATGSADTAALFVGAQGFVRPGQGGRDADEFALAATELYLYVPMVPIASYIPDALAVLIDFAATTFHLDAHWRTGMRRRLGLADTARQGASAVSLEDTFARYADQVTQTLRGCFDFDDRYPIPCSPAGFGEHAQFGIEHGPAGAVWALSRVGAVPDRVSSGYTTWLEKNLDQFGALGNGLLDGWAGNVIVSAELGAHELATRLMDRFLGTTELSASPWHVRGGLAGQILLALWWRAHGGTEVGADWLERATDELERRVREQLGSPTVVTGLLNGLSGAALALFRAHAVLAKPGYLDTARAAMDAELATYIRHDADEPLLYHWDGQIRMLSYLDRGNAGLLIAAAELGSAWEVDADTRGALQRAACSRVGVQPGLYIGLAGGLAANAVLRERTDWFDARYLDRCNEQIATSIAAFCGAGAGGFHVPGQLSARASADFATGAAGVLAAMSFWMGRSRSWLPGICPGETR
ncbi:hypothetical protein [Nocardia sp. XZ_19_369]|uniref:class III lanthionine synthetase LanKC N-terminal domain-containing protein n=1 Tax=Nocardia sp. XZ_19_369 TaxID=2769487 RepID=UPI00188FB2BB|nr:hypothetical protein [Nocardia sp. XZ_19_369]